FKPGVTSAAEQTTLRNEPSDTANPTPYRAWVGPDGAVWGWYSTSESIGPRRLSVYPATGPTVPLSPGNGPGLDQGNLDDGAKVTFHPAGTLVSVRTNASVGTLKWAKTTAAGTTLEPFSPAVQTEGGLHVDVLAGVVPPGQPTDLVAYPTSAGITLARFLPGTGGAAPTLATVATGLTGLPKAWLGANLEPWVFFETASGWTIGHVATGGVFEEYVADVENATEVRQTIDGRPTLWGTLFRRTATGAMCVCRFPTLPPLADDVGCWTASEDDASIAWGPFVSEDGAAYLVSTTVVDSGPNLDVTLFRNRNVAPEFDGPSGCP
ncbi:MAG: hypothetical protein KC635_06470, partial [Myxococcales bacterium]|nr:hypothetical protein [Myxococcales bacterium]